MGNNGSQLPKEKDDVFVTEMKALVSEYNNLGMTPMKIDMGDSISCFDDITNTRNFKKVDTFYTKCVEAIYQWQYVLDKEVEDFHDILEAGKYTSHSELSSNIMERWIKHASDIIEEDAKKEENDEEDDSVGKQEDDSVGKQEDDSVGKQEDDSVGKQEDDSVGKQEDDGVILQRILEVFTYLEYYKWFQTELSENDLEDYLFEKIGDDVYTSHYDGTTFSLYSVLARLLNNEVGYYSEITESWGLYKSSFHYAIVYQITKDIISSIDAYLVKNNLKDTT